jgi:hypothetical protein
MKMSRNCILLLGAFFLTTVLTATSGALVDPDYTFTIPRDRGGTQRAWLVADNGDKLVFKTSVGLKVTVSAKDLSEADRKHIEFLRLPAAEREAIAKQEEAERKNREALLAERLAEDQHKRDAELARQRAAQQAVLEAQREREAAAKAAAEEAAKPSDLDTFMNILKIAGIDNSIISRVSQKGDSLTIIVANAWHYEPYQVRLQAAQNLWETWARIRSPNDPDKARLEITDLNGNNVGGSGWLGGSMIKVKK